MKIRGALWRTIALALVQPFSLAQTFIPQPQDVTFQQSSVLPGASLSFKETDICDTTPGVKSYSGYVTIPSEDNTYNASIFFWYFEARSHASDAPTTLWIPGGPGSSFLDGSSGFPCSVNPDGDSTSLNHWSLNSNVNMLYVDIPVQTGYSYTEAQNGTFDVVANLFTPGTEEDIVTNGSRTVATMSSQDGSQTLNTTQQVARQVWQFSQIWFQEFPEWQTRNKEIELWGYSYSGFFAAASAAYIQQQNDLIADGIYNTTGLISNPITLSLGTLGINNGCIDIESQISYYPKMMVNNTYGIKVVSDEVYEEALEIVDECYGLIAACRDVAAEQDPEGTGAVDEVNAVCLNTTETCFVQLTAIYLSSNRTNFDLALPLPGLYPVYGQPVAFYNQRWVQQSLGVPVNFTVSAFSVAYNMVYGTGDVVAPTYDTLEYILDAGIGVAFVYGDRDFDCNWMAVENISLSMEYPEAPAFRSAGYTPIRTNSSYQGGLVRQHNRVSFSRVFESGHDVAAYQPETVLHIFERAIFGRDVATGEVDVLSLMESNTTNHVGSSCSGRGNQTQTGYSTQGPLSSLNVTNAVLPPVMSEPVCSWYTVNNTQTCSEEQMAAVEDGSAIVQAWVVVSPPSVFLPTSGSPASAAVTAARRA